jgi:hypothetical protein
MHVLDWVGKTGTRNYSAASRHAICHVVYLL